MSRVVGVLLAAGAGKRFGGDKLLHPLPTGELLGVAAARHLVAAVPHTLAVVRPGDHVLAEQFRSLGLRLVENPEADRGMGASLAAGVGASEDAGSWLIALGDMPWIRPETIRSLAGLLAEGSSLVAPVHRGRRGHPVGFSRKWGRRLQALHGEQGARALLAAHDSELTLMPTQDAGVLVDMDRKA